MNAITKGRFASQLAAVVFSIALFTVPVLAHAQYSYDGACCDGGYSYDPGFDYSYYPDGGYSYTPSYDFAYYPEYTSSYYPEYTSSYSPEYTSSYYPEYTSSYYPEYSSSYYPSYDSSYSPSYVDYETYAQDPYYVGSSGIPSYSTSFPAISFDSYPVGYSVGGTSYIPPKTKTPSVSIGAAPIGKPVNIANSLDQNQKQDQNQSQSSYNSNSNSNYNTSSSNSNSESNASAYQTLSNVNNIPITNINSNPIKNTNTNNVNISVSVPEQQHVIPVNQTSVVQYPIQYVFPQQQPIQPYYPPQQYQTPYCTIMLTGGAYGQAATLSWSSTYGSSAYISAIGSVTTSGSRVVSPSGNQVYTMTVYGYGGQTATCQTTAYTMPVVPTPIPQVSLTQIPYTGLDFGTFGNAIYWGALLAFALAAAYLLVYFRGGAAAYAGNVLGRTGAVSKDAYTSPVRVADKSVAPAPVAKSFDLPVVASRNVTVDSMSVAVAEGGTPRIVINRN